ncbi:putative per-hexamer repeat protein 5 [Paramacrobiotus metropolitanus]|uniref:putative per-hexamer repeat protein 5 n=1 Tax=Paramacrobiotus metropolitanus TaxID=2943436 RepID=UPI002445FD3D|nr:putative per-hexamer repeat protein 5 [Paramacrobiotus metropolitanus]
MLDLFFWCVSVMPVVWGYGALQGSYARANNALSQGNNPGNYQFLSLSAAGNRQYNNNPNAFVPSGQPPIRNGNFNAILNNLKPNQPNNNQPGRPVFPPPLAGGQPGAPPSQPAALTGFGQPTPDNTGSKGLQQPQSGIVPPKAICECYIGTLVGNASRDLMDLVLPFGTSRTLTTPRTDTTCRELESQCVQHCRIQQESCLPQGLRTVVPGQSPNISYGSYACKTVTKEDVRRPAGIFYSMEALFCKDEGFISSLSDMYCCMDVDHPFLEGEKLRLFSPNCTATFNTSATAPTAPGGGSTFSTKALTTSNVTTEAPMVIGTMNASAVNQSTTAFVFTLPSTPAFGNETGTWTTTSGVPGTVSGSGAPTWAADTTTWSQFSTSGPNFSTSGWETTTGPQLSTSGNNFPTSGWETTTWSQFPTSGSNFATSGSGISTWPPFPSSAGILTTSGWETTTWASNNATSGAPLAPGSDTFVTTPLSTPAAMFSDAGSSGPVLTWTSDGASSSGFDETTTFASPTANVQLSLTNGPISMNINISAPLNTTDAWTTGSPAWTTGNPGFSNWETTTSFPNAGFQTSGNAGFQPDTTTAFPLWTSAAPWTSTSGSWGDTTTFGNFQNNWGTSAFPVNSDWTTATGGVAFNPETTTFPSNTGSGSGNFETTTTGNWGVATGSGNNWETTTWATVASNQGSGNGNWETTTWPTGTGSGGFNAETTTWTTSGGGWTNANQDLSGSMSGGFNQNSGGGTFDTTTSSFIAPQSFN